MKTVSKRFKASRARLAALLTAATLAFCPIGSMAGASIPETENSFSAAGIASQNAIVMSKLEAQIARLPGLRQAIDSHIALAQKVREEFAAEESGIRDLLGRKLSARERRSFEDDLQRKQEYVRLIDEYVGKLNDAKDYFTKAEDQFRDLRRYHSAIDLAFVYELAQEVREISLLLNDPSIQAIFGKSLAGKAKAKGKRKYSI